MQEILFRGKDNNIEGVDWVYGYYVKCKSPLGGSPLGGFSHMIFSGEMDYDWTRESYFPTIEVRNHVDPSTVGQFTGLTDKNGVKIFEGDVVLVNWFGHNGKFVVGYEGGSFFPYQIGCKFNFNSLWDVWFQNEDGTIMEVIGNIHDNPDLLR